MFVHWVKGFEGVYSAEVSGKVYKHSPEGCIFEVKPYDADTGKGNVYRYVHLYDSKLKKQKAYLLARLVWTTLVGDLKAGEKIRQLDGDRTNCAISNLEVISQATLTSDSADKRATSVAVNKQLSCMDEYINYIKTGQSGYKTKRHSNTKIPVEAFQLAGVPCGIVKLKTRGSSLLESWNFICTYLKYVLNNEYTLEAIKNRFPDMDYTLPSHIRAGRRWVKEKELYLQYKDLVEFNINYKATFKI